MSFTFNTMDILPTMSWLPTRLPFCKYRLLTIIKHNNALKFKTDGFKYQGRKNRIKLIEWDWNQLTFGYTTTLHSDAQLLQSVCRWCHNLATKGQVDVNIRNRNVSAYPLFESDYKSLWTNELEKSRDTTVQRHATFFVELNLSFNLNATTEGTETSCCLHLEEPSFVSL